jgi:hypothetical protein
MPVSQRRSHFRQHDVTRVLRAARAAGLEVSGYEIDSGTGRIIVNTSLPTEHSNPQSDLAQWLSKHGNKIYSKK